MASPDPTRRGALTLAAGAVGAAFWVSRAGAEIYRGEIPWGPSEDDAPYYGTTDARFLTEAEFAALEAMCARIIPSGPDGDPGATEARAAVFIDRQLAAPWGRGENWYMQGPFGEALPTQGYQAPFAPAELYRAALAAVDDHCRAAFDGRGFAELPEAEQDRILAEMDEDRLDLGEAPAGVFFELMRENTIEGFFCDPIYGGNADMVGWRLVGFPGARYDYRPWLDHDGRRLDLPPVGLSGRPDWSDDDDARTRR